MQHLLGIRRKQEEVREKQIELLMVLVGNMTMSWAIVERILDELIANYQHVGTDLQREHPRSLSSKLKYLRLMQCDKRLTGPVREWLRTTRLEARRLGNKRHESVHGLLWRQPVGGGVWQSQRVIYEGATARLHITKVSIAELKQTISEITALLADIAPKVWVITRGDVPAYTPEDIAKAKRELGFIE